MLGAHPLVGLQRGAGNRAVQRLVSGSSHEIDGEAISERIGEAEGAGSSLEPGIRQRLTDALGADPGDVRVHTDGEADELSQSLAAKAFTSGRDIFFRGGTFDPATPEGFELLVHESTHVLQQAEGPVAGTPTGDGALAISDPGDPFEQAASARGAAAPLARADAGAGRPVQRWPDMDDLSSFVGDTVDAQAAGPGPTMGMLGSFTNAISDDAASGDLGMGTVRKIADTEEKREAAKGAELRSSQKTFDSDVDAATSWLGGGAVERFGGGMAKEVFGMGAGLESMIQNPIGFQKAQSAQASKEALPMVTGQYFDTLGKVGRGEEGLGDAAGEIYGAFQKGKDNEWDAKKAAAQPAVDDAKKGDWAGAFGRVGAELGVAVLGMGEVPVGEVGAGAEAAAGAEEAASIGENTPKPPLPAEPAPLGGIPEAPEPPGVRILKRNPKFVSPDTPDVPGFFDVPDEGAETQRPPIEIDPDADPGAPTRRPTLPGIGPEFEPAPDTRRDSGPPTLRDGPPTLRGVAPDANVPAGRVVSPEASSVRPGALGGLPEAAPADGPLPVDFGEPTPLDDPSFVDPEPAFDPVGLLQEDPERIRKRLWG